MRKIVTMLVVATAALTSTIGMASDGQQHFTRDGSTYRYTVTTASGGRQIIEGRRYPVGDSFRLIVRGSRVSGFSGGLPVSFNIAQPRGPATPTVVETAAR